MKPGTSVLRSTRLLDQLQEQIRYLHYSLNTEKAYLDWVRFFVRWHGRNGEMRHTRDMGAAEVDAFLNMLANERKVSASTHNQALSVILFLYREVLGIDLPWLDGVNRSAQKRRNPSVLTKEEVRALFQFMENDMRLLAQLLYGTGMRLMEGLRLRIKDVDFDRHVIIVREAKGNKDRVVMLPRSLATRLRQQLGSARSVWEQDRQAQRNGVQTPHALEKKYPKVGSTWWWFWLFPSPTLSVDPVSGGSAVTICLRSGCNVPSKRRWRRRAFANRCQSTHCGTVLPRICCKRAPTSAWCRNCWGTATRPPP